MGRMIISGLRTFAGDEEGSTAIEYGLIAATFGLVLVVIMPLLTPAIKSVFQHIIDSILNVANAWS